MNHNLPTNTPIPLPVFNRDVPYQEWKNPKKEHGLEKKMVKITKAQYNAIMEARQKNFPELTTASKSKPASK